jgi:hypothetical protein
LRPKRRAGIFPLYSLKKFAKRRREKKNIPKRFGHKKAAIGSHTITCEATEAENGAREHFAA